MLRVSYDLVRAHQDQLPGGQRRCVPVAEGWLTAGAAVVRRRQGYDLRIQIHRSRKLYYR
jgi:hypothetical protein